MKSQHAASWMNCTSSKTEEETIPQEGPIERQKVDPSAGDGDYLCLTILNWELKNSKKT